MRLWGPGVWLLGVLLTAGCGAFAAPGAGGPASGSAGPRTASVTPSPGPGTAETAQAVAFVTNSRGWATAASGSGSPGMDILATVDGGRSWTVQWHGTGTPGLLDAVTGSRAFVTVDHCRHRPAQAPCATTLLATAGSGVWEPVWSSSAQVTGMAFADGSRGVAAVLPRRCAQPHGLAPARCPGELLATVDGGRHWRTVLRRHDPLVAVATDGRRWWAVESALGIARPPAFLHLTVWSSAGGTTWTKAGRIGGLDILSGQSQARMVVDAGGGLWLSFLDQGSCAMHGCATDGAWHSSDGGAHWTSVTPQPPPAGGGCGLAGRPVIAVDPAGGVHAADGKPQATCPPPATTLFTWSARRWQAAHNWAKQILAAMSWPSPRTGYIVAGGRLQKTTDAGASWNTIWPR